MIDYAICNAEAWEEINKIEIGDRAESDHRPIEVTLVKMIDRKKRKGKEREIEDWSEKECKEYRRKVKERKETKEGTQEEWKELTREVRNAITKKEIKIREAIPGKRTWCPVGQRMQRKQDKTE